MCVTVGEWVSIKCPVCENGDVRCRVLPPEGTMPGGVDEYYADCPCIDSGLVNADGYWGRLRAALRIRGGRT